MNAFSSSAGQAIKNPMKVANMWKILSLSAVLLLSGSCYLVADEEEDTVNALLLKLQSPQQKDRSFAASKLRNYTKYADKIVPELLKVLDDGPEMQYLAGIALGTYNNYPDSAFDIIYKHVRDTEYTNARIMLLHCLSKFPNKGALTIPLACKYLDDEFRQEDVARASLGLLSAAGKDSVPHLLRYLEKPDLFDFSVQHLVRKTEFANETAPVIFRLIRMKKDPRSQAFQLMRLRFLGTNAKVIAPELAQMIEENDHPDTSYAATIALAYIDPSLVNPTILKIRISRGMGRDALDASSALLRIKGMQDEAIKSLVPVLFNISIPSPYEMKEILQNIDEFAPTQKELFAPLLKYYRAPTRGKANQALFLKVLKQCDPAAFSKEKLDQELES